jgi:hypothetical protein
VSHPRVAIRGNSQPAMKAVRAVTTIADPIIHADRTRGRRRNQRVGRRTGSRTSAVAPQNAADSGSADSGFADSPMTRPTT